MSRAMGLDVGSRRIGVALSDESRLLAHPLTTVTVSGVRNAVEQISALIDDFQVADVVIGLPITMAGSEGEQARITRLFGAALGQSRKVAIHYVDERLTSKLSEAHLRESGVSKRLRKGKSDVLAALYILQVYLDQRHS